MNLQEAEMNRKLSEFAEGKLSEGIAELKDTDLEAVRFFRQENRIEIALHNDGPLSFHSYHELQERLHDMTGSAVMIHLDCDHDGISNAELKQYFDDLCQCKAEYQSIADTNFIYEEKKNSLVFIFSNQEARERADAYTEDISDYLDQIGIKGIHVTCSMMKPEHPDIKKVAMEILPEAPEEKPVFNSYQRKSSYRAKKDSDYTEIALHEVTGDIYGVKFTADVFAKEEIETKKQTIIQNLSVYDGTDAIVIKRFEGRGTTREDLASINEGDRVTVFGRIAYDSYSKELVCQPDRIEKVEKKKITDDAPVKRVEWHMHTNMSEMDGICSPIEVVNTAFDLGQPGIVITDHADVQSLVKAFNTGEACRKSDPDRPFKVGLGCEMNMVDDRLLIVRNPIDKNIDDEEYVSFDLETTGLSCYYDSIIEFGAVKLKNQSVIDRLQMFIKPPHDIPAYITNKTNITNAMVADAKSFADSIDTILDWIGNDTIVAHNATFDYHFLNEELKRIDRAPMTNCVIDTLDLSRAILRDRRAYRLGNVARNYHVAYDEEVAHRADYDAESLSGVFICLLKDAKDKFGCMTIEDLQEKTQDFEVYKKVRHSHICVVAKNQDGIRDLYKLVSESNTTTLAVMGKNAGKEGTDVAAEPRIRRSTLQKYRDNLLFGSACQNSELWELACNGDDQRLETCMKFYDYIELQPLANYTTFVALGSVPSMDRVKDVQRRVIAMAQKLNIPVIADSDAHYLKKEQKIFRDIYIMSQGVGGVTHPLYIRDDMLRRKTPNPEQHLRLTNEMKKEFSWLEDDALVEKLVVTNPLRLI
jgi:DNA polymerase-3 subunit alpha (Gram-positive type)